MRYTRNNTRKHSINGYRMRRCNYKARKILRHIQSGTIPATFFVKAANGGDIVNRVRVTVWHSEDWALVELREFNGDEPWNWRVLREMPRSDFTHNDIVWDIRPLYPEVF